MKAKMIISDLLSTSNAKDYLKNIWSDKGLEYYAKTAKNI